MPSLDPTKARHVEAGRRPKKVSFSKLGALHKASASLSDRTAQRRQRKQAEECSSCPDPTIAGSKAGAPYNECSRSRRPCGHHCNCSWTQDICHWCGVEFGEEMTDIQICLDRDCPNCDWPELVGVGTVECGPTSIKCLKCSWKEDIKP